MAAVYSVTKSGGKNLELGPEVGASRKEALRRLLEAMEGEVGRMMVRDARRGRGEAPGVGLEGRGGEKLRSSSGREYYAIE